MRKIYWSLVSDASNASETCRKPPGAPDGPLIDFRPDSGKLYPLLNIKKYRISFCGKSFPQQGGPSGGFFTTGEGTPGVETPVNPKGEPGAES